MSITDHALQFVAIDILGFGASGEFFEAHINCVSSELHGRKKRFEAAGRGKEFRFLLCEIVHYNYLLNRKKKPGKPQPDGH